MKKDIPKVWERESEASILWNDREREFPLTPGRNPQSPPLRELISKAIWDSFQLIDSQTFVLAV